MTLTWTAVDSPIGALLLVASPKGLMRVAFELEDFSEVRREITRRSGHHLSEAVLPEATTQFAEYFAGQRRRFTLSLDWSLSGGFYGRVQQALRQIPFGFTRTYAQIASEVGRPGASRAVGTACRTNPLPIVVPCHRVVRSDGSPGRYRGGSKAKEFLLNLEAENRLRQLSQEL